jgi:outer membrane murein-binding lipoprotein Lpp
MARVRAGNQEQLQQSVRGSAGGGFRMKNLIGVLGVLALGSALVVGCSSQSKIDQATSQAESSSQQASTAATNAQNSANQAAQSAKGAEEAAAGAQDSVKRANDAVARLEAAFASSVTK